MIKRIHTIIEESERLSERLVSKNHHREDVAISVELLKIQAMMTQAGIMERQTRAIENLAHEVGSIKIAIKDQKFKPWKA